jgi:hypothetical protein
VPPRKKKAKGKKRWRGGAMKSKEELGWDL